MGQEIASEGIPQEEPPGCWIVSTGRRIIASSERVADSWAPPVKVFVWVTACLAWTFLLPGGLAYYADVFTAAQVQDKVQALPAYQACRNAAGATDLICAAGRTACDLTIPVARFFAAASDAQRPRIAFFGFVESRTCYCYFLATFALGVLVWRHNNRIPWNGLAWGTGVFIFVVWGGLSWWRAFFEADAARTIFSFVHWDVHPAGFWVQEARTFFLCVLVATVWRHAETPVRVSADEPVIFDPERLNKVADELGARVERRQIDSLFLGVAFFPWTLYYWSLKARWGDPRYFMSTLIWHMVWGISLWFLSEATFLAWHQFGRHRAGVRAALMAGDSKVRGERREHDERPEHGEDLNAKLQWLDNLKPVSTVRVALTGAAAIVTFFLPLVKAFL